MSPDDFETMNNILIAQASENEILMEGMAEEIRDLKAQLAEAISALEDINNWCGTDDGCHALPYAPPWADKMYRVLESQSR